MHFPCVKKGGVQKLGTLSQKSMILSIGYSLRLAFQPAAKGSIQTIRLGCVIDGLNRFRPFILLSGEYAPDALFHDP